MHAEPYARWPAAGGESADRAAKAREARGPCGRADAARDRRDRAATMSAIPIAPYPGRTWTHVPRDRGRRSQPGNRPGAPAIPELPECHPFGMLR